MGDSLQEVMKYFYDNHEHVIDVNMEVLRDNFGYQRWDDKAFVTFMNKGAADRFISLAYVRFKGNKITRCSVSDYKDIQAGKGKKAGAGAAPGNKRKLPEDEKKPVELEKGAAIMIKGIENKHTKIKDNRDKLKAVDVKLQDIVYVGYENGEGEAQVRLKGASSDGVAELIKKLNNSNILMGDEISVSKLTGKAEKELAEKTKEPPRKLLVILHFVRSTVLGIKRIRAFFTQTTLNIFSRPDLLHMIKMAFILNAHYEYMLLYVRNFKDPFGLYVDSSGLVSLGPFLQYLKTEF